MSIFLDIMKEELDRNLYKQAAFDAELQKTILIFGMISMSLIIIFLILIIIYCIIKTLKDKNKLNPKIIIDSPNSKNNDNINTQDFKSVANSSTIGNESGQNNSLSEIKEKNLKDEIHNIIHSSNVNTDSERKKKKKKNGKKSQRDDSPRNNLENNKMNESNEISTKKLENDIKNQIKQFVRDDDEKK